MTYGDIDEDFIHNCPVVQSYRKTISDCSLCWIVVVESNLWIFDAIHFSTEVIDSRIFGDIILVIFRCQTSEDQGDGNLLSNVSV